MFLKNASYSVATNLISSAIALLQSVLVARYLGANALGVIAASQAILLTLRSIVGFRLDEAATFFINRLDFDISGQRKEAIKIVSTVFTLEIITITTASFLSIFGFFVIVKFGNEGNYDFYILLLAIIVLFTSALDALFTTIIRYQHKYKFLSAVEILTSISSISLIIILISIGELNIYTYLFCLLFLGISKYLFYWTTVQGFVKNKLKFNLSLISGLLNNSNSLRFRSYQSRFFSFIKAGYVSSSLSQLCKSSPFLLLALISTSEMVGNFRVAMNLANLGSYLITPFNNVLFQWLNKFHGNLTAIGFCHLYKGRLMLWSLIVLFITIVVWFVAADLITFLYGNSYSDSVTIFRILLCGICFNNAFFWVRTLALIQGYEKAVYSTTTYISLLQLSIIYPLSFFCGVNSITFSLSLAWALSPIAFFIAVMKQRP
jgi:O-antigen/teichoic acid export membrane protein